MRKGSMARIREKEAGSVVIEFAFTLPLLLLVIMGIFDFGLVFREALLATNAAREGARMAVLPGYVEADVTDRVTNYLTVNGVTATPTVSAPPTCVPSSVGYPFTVRTVTVTFDHTFAYLAPIAKVFGGSFDKVTLKGTSVMRTEIALPGVC